jgi:hypothetical protein
MADKGKNHEIGSARIPSGYTMYEAEGGGKFLIPQFMVNATKVVTNVIERKENLDLLATTSKVSLLFTPTCFGFECHFEAACTRRPRKFNQCGYGFRAG